MNRTDRMGMARRASSPSGRVDGSIPVIRRQTELGAGRADAFLKAAVEVSRRDLGIPDFHAGYMLVRCGRARPSDELRQALHVMRQELADGRSPGSIGHRLVIDGLGKGEGLTVCGEGLGGGMRADVVRGRR